MKKLALIPVLAAALYGADKPCTIHPSVTEHVGGKGYTLIKFEPKAAHESVGNLRPGCYTIASKDPDHLYYYSEDGMPIGVFANHEDKWVWSSATEKLERVYESNDPTTFLYQSSMLDDKQLTVWADGRQPVYQQVSETTLVPLKGETANAAREYVLGFARRDIAPGTYVVVKTETFGDGKHALSGKRLMTDGRCTIDHKCAVEEFSSPTRK